LNEPTIAFTRRQASGWPSRDERIRGIAATSEAARVLAVKRDHLEAAAVTAGSGGGSGVVDDARCLQRAVDRDLQQALRHCRVRLF
jgi:hypothetical protein